IARVSYLGSGIERASNGWHKACDLLIVAGTPRIAHDAVQSHLLQCDETEAAADPDKGNWGPVAWRGYRQDGSRVIVQSHGYRNPAWRRAHHELVRAQLVQAVGRSRGLLPDGIPSVVVSTDECGCVIAPWDIRPVSDRQE